MKYCPNCNDWAENIEVIDGPLVLSQLRSGEQAKLKTFHYCPWCGWALAEKEISEEKK